MSCVEFSYCREASETRNPAEALETAYQHQFGLQRDSHYTVAKFRQAFAKERSPGKKSKSPAAGVNAIMQPGEADAPSFLCKEGQKLFRRIRAVRSNESRAEIFRKALDLLLKHIEVMGGNKEISC